MKMFSTKLLRLPYLMVVLLIFVSINGFTKTTEEELRLRGKWKFIIGDNKEFAHPNYDDSKWDKIKTPSSWRQQGYGQYDGYAWYRRNVELAVYESTGTILLELGYIHDVDETYFNGHLIGRTGRFPPKFVSAHKDRRIYEIPRSIINKNGKNVVAVRVYDHVGMGGIIGPKIGVFNSKAFIDNSIQLSGIWKFQVSDDERWSSRYHNDSEWEAITVPSNWESQGFKNYDGIAWYRKEFEIPKKFDTDDLVLIIGRIDDTDEAYINGEKVGSTGLIGAEMVNDQSYRKTRSYIIPNGLLESGIKNNIAIRVFDRHGAGGIVSGPVVIIRSSDYKEFWKKYKRSHSNYSNKWAYLYY